MNIDLNFKQLVDIVNRLSPSEKLKLNEILWAENMEIPIEHQKIAFGRLQKSKEKTEKIVGLGFRS